MLENKIHYRRIDIIRVLSCILVLLYHLDILKGGFLVVCTFFTLSGYLSCMTAIKKDEFSIKEYYINKFKKIYLPLIVVVFITVIISKTNTIFNWMNLRNETISVVFGYNNFWQLSAKLDYFSSNINSPFTHLWYIAILLQFDIVFPFFYLLFKKMEENIRKNISTIAISILTILSTVFFYYMSVKENNITIVYYNTFARSFSFFFGILLALIHYKHRFKISKYFEKQNTAIFIVYNILLIMVCFFLPSEPKVYSIFMILTTIISTRLIEYSVIISEEKEKMDKHIRALSKVSYEIYLVQYPIIFFMRNVGINYILKDILIILITLLVSFILHLVLFYPLKTKKNRNIRIALLSLLIIIGSIFVITEKDHSLEMDALENRLNENMKIIELNNKEFLNRVNIENDEWNTILEEAANEEKGLAEKVSKLPVVGIGDSVLLGATKELYNKFPNGYFDGKISRTIWGSEDLLIDLKNKGKLSNTIIFCLATNGDYSEKRNKELMDIVQNREVYWVNAVGADDASFNGQFKKFASNYPNLHIVDWESVAKKHPEYLEIDKIHPNREGAKVLVDLIYENIYNEYLKEYTNRKNQKISEHENELKSRISFWGNDVLTNCSSDLSENYEKAIFNAKSDYTFESLYKELKEKIDNKSLEYKVIFVFDKKIDLSENEYKEIIELCKERKIYIFNLTEKKYSLSNENVKIINFYDEIKNNERYLIADNVHLSEEGNKALVDLIIKEVEK